ncbi:hypothetical protein N7541_003269 [Penicillium brevicompactum]|uniref:Uncharacterized protein n=1 Tax=Penicillium brevicompactum TaxID=5074 RepID=A0A9W9V0W8_PENBR|nr:hypothetical protein N7541_003269 [Penicillium brevicompactum]
MDDPNTGPPSAGCKMSPEQNQPSREPSISSSGESKPSPENSISKNTQSDRPAFNDTVPRYPDRADSKNMDEFLEKLRIWRANHLLRCDERYWFPNFEETYFWPLDTAKKQDAHSSELGIHTQHWHAFAYHWHDGANPPIQPLKDESILESWYTYYDQLVSEKEDLLDRWITESMRDMGLDPGNLTDDEDA